MSNITTLLSVDNLYDQPDNNLVCWWSKKPSIEVLCKAIYGKTLDIATDDEIAVVVGVWQGKYLETKDGTTYRLETHEEGEIL